MAEEFGVSISRSGVPVDKSPDYSKVLDSRWRTLQIPYESSKTFTFPASAGDGSWDPPIAVFNHNLGFFPLTEVGTSIPHSSPANIFPAATYVDILIDKSNIYMVMNRDRFSPQPAQTVVIKYRVYNIDIGKDYQEEAEVKLGSGTGKSDHGVKFATEGNRIDDGNPRHFSTDTTKKQLAVHQVKIFEEDSFQYKVEHNVGYPPSYMTAESPRRHYLNVYFMGDVKVEEYYGPVGYDREMVGPIYDFSNFSTADGTYLTLKGIQSTQTAPVVIVLKDPLGISV